MAPHISEGFRRTVSGSTSLSDIRSVPQRRFRLCFPLGPRRRSTVSFPTPLPTPFGVRQIRLVRMGTRPIARLLAGIRRTGLSVSIPAVSIALRSTSLLPIRLPRAEHLVTRSIIGVGGLPVQVRSSIRRNRGRYPLAPPKRAVRAGFPDQYLRHRIPTHLARPPTLRRSSRVDSAGDAVGSLQLLRAGSEGQSGRTGSVRRPASGTSPLRPKPKRSVGPPPSITAWPPTRALRAARGFRARIRSSRALLPCSGSKPAASGSARADPKICRR